MKKISFAIILALFSFAAFAAEADLTDGTASNVCVVSVEGVITQATADFVDESIAGAPSKGCELFMIELNTPGGVLDATRNVVGHILESPLPTIVYVTPSGARAASAGIFLTLAANFAVMNEGTNMGAAHPVVAGGRDIEGDMRQKVENDTEAFVRSIAQKRGRNVNAAVKMVMESSSYTASEALKEKLIDAVATEKEGIGELIEKRFELAGPISYVRMEPTFLQKVGGFLSNPDILAGLLFLGIVLIGLEFKMPGTFLFAAAGAVCLVLFAIGANIIPVNYLAFLLIIAGFGLLAAEIFITSFGLLTVGGIVCLLFGLRMLFDRSESVGVSVSVWVMIVVTALVAATALVIGRLLYKDYKRKPASGMETLIGKNARVLDWKDGCGHVAIYGEIWNASGKDDIKEGDEVKIENFGDMVLKVKKGGR